MRAKVLLPKTELATKSDIKTVVQAARLVSYDKLVHARWKRNKDAQMVLHQLALAISSLDDGYYPNALMHYGLGISSVDKGSVGGARGDAFVAYNLLVRTPLEQLLARIPRKQRRG